MCLPIRKVVPVIEDQNGARAHAIRHPRQHSAHRFVQIAVNIREGYCRMKPLAPLRNSALKPAGIDRSIGRQIRNRSPKIETEFPDRPAHCLRHASPAIKRMIYTVRTAWPHEPRDGALEYAKFNEVALGWYQWEHRLQQVWPAGVGRCTVSIGIEPLSRTGSSIQLRRNSNILQCRQESR